MEGSQWGGMLKMCQQGEDLGRAIVLWQLSFISAAFCVSDFPIDPFKNVIVYILCKLLSLHLLVIGMYQDDDSILIHHLVTGQSHPFEVSFQVPCSTKNSAASQIMWYLSPGNSYIKFALNL